MRKILLVLLLIGFDAYGNERECLAENVYFEARGQGQAGWVAVAQVTLNRVQDTRFPNTICEVVKQGLTYESGHPIKNKCQFSWYCDGKADEPQNENSWTKSVDHAVTMYSGGEWRGLTEGSTHYHATYVSPSWAKEFTKIVQIGAHIFYRMEN